MSVLILASTSPRRKELLHKIIDDFIIEKPVCDEVEQGDPLLVAQENATKKGRAVRGDFVIACDTVVEADGVVFGKPKDEEDAFAILQALNGRTHHVVSGLYVRFGREETVCYDVSNVTFKQLSDEELKFYIKNYNPFDKAGAYGIQDDFLVEKYTGSLDNIIGLPTEKLREILRKYVCVKEEYNY